MSNLENLTAKIVADGKRKAADMMDTAKNQAAVMLEARKQEANVEAERLLAIAETEGERLKERLVEGRKIEMRNNQLAARRQLIDNVLDMAVKRLRDLPKDQFEDFVYQCIAKTPTDGGEALVLPEQYKKSFDIAALNNKLASAGHSGHLVPYEGPETIDGGFKLSGRDMENDFSFSSLISYYRDDLEKIVAENLLRAGD